MTAPTGTLPSRRCFWLVAIVLLAGCDSLGYLQEDAIAALAHEEDTEYAAGYSPDAFKKVAIGMSEAEVKALLGPPLETYAPGPATRGEYGWRYARSARGGSYRIRALLFRSGRVSEIFHEFYLD